MFTTTGELDGMATINFEFELEAVACDDDAPARYSSATMCI